MSLKFGLNLKKKPGLGTGKPALGNKKKKPVFDEEEEDTQGNVKATDDAQEIGEFNFEDTLETSSKPEKSSTLSKPKGKPLAPPTRKPKPKEDDPSTFANLGSLQAAEMHAKEAMELDPSIYDYDTAYDALHAKTAAKKAAEREDAAQRKAKYIGKLFESAELRKKDQLSARDKVIQREREAEGDEFADKDKFVTGAYKAQQEEARKAEEEEKKRQEAEDEQRRKFGMQSFHKKMLMEEEKRHQEAVEAAARLVKEGVKLDAEEPKEKTEAEVAREMQEKGKNIVLNEEGQVVDKRQLLTAGLNVVSKPKSATTTLGTSSQATSASSAYQGRNATQRAVRGRQTEMMVEQLEKAAKRKADEEAEEQRKVQHAAKSQKTEGEISSAKERYLQRKREAAAAKAAAAGK